jgi:hypothetical protein
MEMKEDLLELHEAVEFLIKKENADFFLFREGIEIKDVLHLYSYEQTLKALHLSKKYADHLFFLIKQRLSSFLLLSDGTCIKISNDFCSTPEEFYDLIILHFNKKYKYPTLNKEIEGKICISRSAMAACPVNSQVYSEGNIRQILEYSLEEREISPFLLYFCYLATHQKSLDFQSVSHKTQYEVVEILDPHKKYDEFGLKVDPLKEINEPFLVMRLFIKNYKPVKGRPSNITEIYSKSV